MTSLRLHLSFLFAIAVASFAPNPALKTSALQMKKSVQPIERQLSYDKRTRDDEDNPEEPARFERPLGELPVAYDQQKNHIEVRCFRSMMTYAQTYRYENSPNGMVLFRGGKNYENSFFRLNSTADAKMNLRRLLKMADLLEADRCMEGAHSLYPDDPDSIVATIRVMALLQQYGDLVENLATPMLKIGKDLRVEASFAFQGDTEAGRDRVVRALLVPKPGPVDLLETSKTLWTEKNTRDASYLIQRLGNSEMLLVELEGLLPASAVRSQSRSGYVLVHEQDLKYFHELRKQHAEGKTLDELMTLKEADGLIGSDGWDALDYRVVDLCIPDNVTFEEFFDAQPGEEVNPFPGFRKEQLYPVQDPMANVISDLAKELED